MCNKEVMIPILLTASVDTRGMSGAKFAALEREKMYVDTLNYYIDDLGNRQGMYELVFAENSGWDKHSILSKLHSSESVYIEYLAIDYADFDQSKGKGFNEMLLIDKAIDMSSTIRDNGAFFKLTGRFPILNLYDLLKEVEKRGGKNMQLYADCKDHKLYDWLHMPINGHAGECRYYAVSLDFWNKHMNGRYVELDDYRGPLIEDFFLQVMRSAKGQTGVTCRYRTQACFSGNGGHSLGKGLSFFYSTNNDSVMMKFKRGLRQCVRWILPWWWC